MDPQVFYEVLVPLMEVEGTATICISTPLGKFNFYTELTEARDERGRTVFNVLHITGGRPPPWKTQSSRSRIKAIYGARETLYRREILGEMSDEAENAAFSPKHLEHLFTREPAVPPYPITHNYVYVALDPNGGASASGGPGSETAIVSFVLSDGMLVIIGLDSHPTPGPDQARELLYAHVAAIQRQQHFAECTIMLILEANLGNEAQHCAKYMLRRHPRVEVLCQKEHAYGVYTSPGDPERYVHTLQERLNVRGVKFHNQLVCANRYNKQTTPEQMLEKTKREFMRQLSAFRAVHSVPTSLGAAVRILYTGKAGPDGRRSSRLKDDMCMALLFGLYYCLRLHAPQRLVTVRNRNNMLINDPQIATQFEGGAPVDFAAEAAAARARGKRAKRIGSGAE